jgi:hypothetical protein
MLKYRAPGVVESKERGQGCQGPEHSGCHSTLVVAVVPIKLLLPDAPRATPAQGFWLLSLSPAVCSARDLIRIHVKPKSHQVPVLLN